MSHCDRDRNLGARLTIDSLTRPNVPALNNGVAVPTDHTRSMGYHEPQEYDYGFSAAMAKIGEDPKRYNPPPYIVPPNKGWSFRPARNVKEELVDKGQWDGSP